MNLFKKIHLRILAFFLTPFFRIFHRRLRKDINFQTISQKQITNPDYKIDDFKDILFNVDSQKRETFAILKLLRTFHLAFLCNDTYSWVAINIPLDLCGEKIEGDIDILIAMVVFPPNNKKEIKKIYRAFEAKVSKIDKYGVGKSLKLGKFDKTRKQLDKLIKVGSQQTFLLEIFLLEADYHRKFMKLPIVLVSNINKKVKEISRDDFGYVCIFLEQERGFDEEKGLIYHTPKSLKGATIKEVRNPIESIINYIEDFCDKEKKRDGGIFPFVAYCKKCEKLNLLYAEDLSYACKYCGKDIF